MGGQKPRIGMYEVGRTLGEGRFAKVKFGRHKETGDSVAIKVIEKDRVRKVNKLVKREISTMKLVKHPHVVRLVEVLASKRNVYIVLEYVDGGELFDKIVDSGKLGEKEARKYFQQLVCGVDYCHSRGVYHRDLKPENLLLDAKGNIKISDFGLSALSQQQWEDGLLHTTCGTPNYVAPEVMDGKGYEGAAADLWSCGIILFVLLAGSFPFNDSNLSNLYQKIHKADVEFLPGFPVGPQQLIRRLLDPNPGTRFTMKDISENEWFQGGGDLIEFAELGKCDDLDMCLANGNDLVERVQEVPMQDGGPVLMNAFEIISVLSQGLDLSGLFIEKEDPCKKETKFTSTQPATEIVSKIEDFAVQFGYKVRSRNFKMRIQSSKPGRKGYLSISTEVMEVAPSLFMVDMHKTSGDTLEFRDFRQELSRGLKDIIVWKSEVELAACG